MQISGDEAMEPSASSETQEESVILRPTRSEDGPRIAAWLAQDRSLRGNGGSPVSYLGVKEIEEKFPGILSSTNPPVVALEIEKQEGLHIGSLRMSLDLRNRVGTLTSIYIAGEHRGGDYAAQALRSLLGFSFDSLLLHRVEIQLPETSKKALALCESCGFKVEGTKRESFFDGQGFRNHILIAILREEFRADNKDLEVGA